MNLATLPDRRAAAAPHAPAVADDHTDLDNTAFLDAVQRAELIDGEPVEVVLAEQVALDRRRQLVRPIGHEAA